MSGAASWIDTPFVLGPFVAARSSSLKKGPLFIRDDHPKRKEHKNLNEQSSEYLADFRSKLRNNTRTFENFETLYFGVAQR